MTTPRMHPRRASRLSYLLATALAAVALFAPDVSGQERTRFTFHLYVDPVYGDDAQAMTSNPTWDPSSGGPGFSRGLILQQHPSYTFFPLDGRLQHAPFSFRTVGQALAWIDGLRQSSTPPARTPLPYHAGDGFWVDYIVIHCLPGLYGPSFPPVGAVEEYDAASGLPWNGESFPLEIPGRVSIQGASALDTIFDARGSDPRVPAAANSIFLMRDPTISISNPPAHEWQYTFVDSVTVRGCRARPEHVGTPYVGPAILIQDESPVNATISNCFIYGNTVGVAVIRGGLPGSLYIHEPTIVNNTFAWNEIGVVNTSAHANDLVYIEGFAHYKGSNILTCINNVFDSSMPSGADQQSYFGGLYGVSGFEGVDSADLTVQSKANCPAAAGNRNAFDARRNFGRKDSLGQVITWSWRINQFLPAIPRSQNFAVSPPTVALDTFTAPPASAFSRSTVRGVLYINDVFRTDPALSLIAPRISPHDFRLAPMAREVGGPAPVLNPLVDRGVDLPGNITMLNGKLLSTAPGLPASAEDLATLHAFDQDGEGAGNLRILARTDFPSGGCTGSIDLGADELGNVIISGYLDSTRIFSRAHTSESPNTAALASGRRLFFFNVHRDPATPRTEYVRPQFNVALDLRRTTPYGHQQSYWYRQLGVPTVLGGVAVGNPYTIGTDNYAEGLDTSGVTTRRYRLVTTPASPTFPYPFPRFHRNPVCDLSPNLYHDIWPFPSMPDNWWIDYTEYQNWILPQGVTADRVTDLFRSNPWYHQRSNLYSILNDNGFLYYTPAKPVQLGVVRPPTTVYGVGGTMQSSYLFRNSVHGIGIYDFNIPNPPQVQPYIYAVDPSGIGDRQPGLGLLGEPLPAVPGQDWQGLRINAEVFAPADPWWQTQYSPPVVNNLQTFLIVERYAAGGDVPPLGGVEFQQGARASEVQRLDAHRATAEKLSVAKRRIESQRR
ncbi:MAG: hypothetical protein IT458_19895 [Planctomycetes bacterium]|nr:hypothetical protein [Planctomycetota bacterium]